MSEIVLKDIVKSYSDVEVIKNVNISIKEGEFCVFVGPSGCGKSTLLRSIAGLEEVNSGDILIDGVKVNDVEPASRGVAMVFQSYALYPHMSVEDNMGFGLKMNGIDKNEVKKRVQEAASILKLTDYLDRKPKALSGGQRQRVAIGRAIVRDPKVFLFDEPLSNLDAELRVEMRTELVRLHNDIGATMIYVTHDQIEAMTLADKIAILKDGIVQQFDTPKDIYKDPNNLFVASFIGSPSMNFLDVAIKGNADEVYIELIADGKLKRLDIPKNSALNDYIGREVIAGIRPEHIQNGFRDERIKDELVDIDLRVKFSELTGADGYLFVDLGGKEILCRVSPSGIKNRGEIITLKAWMRQMLFFDKDTHLRIK